MIIANDLGPVGHAWLDAGLLDESCAGLRCRLLIGEQGGVLCDMVTGVPGRRIPGDMLREAAASIATHAVVNTDPRSTDPLPIVDDAGRTCRILVDGQDLRDLAVPDRRTVARSDESVVCGESSPRSHLRSFTNRTIAYGAMSLIAVLCAVATHERQDASPGVMLFIAGIMASGAFKWFRRAKDERTEHPERVSRHAGSMRELERRARLPETVS
jgi:hypothetical protein